MRIEVVKHDAAIISEEGNGTFCRLSYDEQLQLISFWAFCLNVRYCFVS